jgi:hypothetical protein
MHSVDLPAYSMSSGLLSVWMLRRYTDRANPDQARLHAVRATVLRFVGAC